MDPTKRKARLRGMRSRFVLALSLLLAAPTAALSPSRALAGPPAASSAPAKLVVIADAPVSRKAVAGLGSKLPARWTLGDDTDFRKALSAEGQRTSAGIALGSASGRAALAKKGRAAAEASGVAAVLFVRVTPKGRTKRAVTLLLVGRSSDEPLVDTVVEAPTSDDGDALVPALASALEKLAPPPADAPPPEPGPSGSPDKPGAPEEPSADKPKIELGGHETSILVFSAGGGIGARVFRYHDGLSPLLRSYDLSAAPNLVIAAEVYPFAHLSIPVLRGLGVAGGIQRAVGVSSETSTGTSISTTFWRVEGALRLRFTFGEDARFVLGVQGGVVKERFGFEGDKAIVPWLPDVDYLFGKVGVDGRLRAGPIALLAGFSYLPAVKGGTLADQFRDTSVGAIEVGGGLAVPIVRLFEMRATAVYTRAFYSFHPEPGDAYVAGGALDHFIRAQILATLLL
jgi:hypothetical protein